MNEPRQPLVGNGPFHIWEDPNEGAQVITDRVLSAQVCVPHTWSHEKTEDFLIRYEIANDGRRRPAWSFISEGETVPCAEREGFVHEVWRA